MAKQEKSRKCLKPPPHSELRKKGQLFTQIRMMKTFDATNEHTACFDLIKTYLNNFGIYKRGYFGAFFL
jgi:hypothetical protein